MTAYRHNHYVPVRYQRKFMYPKQSRYFRLDLIGGLLHRDGQRWSEIGLCLLRRRAGAAISGQAAHPRRGAAHRREHRQAAGAVVKQISGFQKIVGYQGPSGNWCVMWKMLRAVGIPPVSSKPDHRAVRSKCRQCTASISPVDGLRSPISVARKPRKRFASRFKEFWTIRLVL
jgi:hypothetical protein